MFTFFSILNYLKWTERLHQTKPFFQDISTSQIINSLYLQFDPKRNTSKLTEHFLLTFSLYVLTITVSLHVFSLLKLLILPRVTREL